MQDIYHVERLSSIYPPKYITSFTAPSMEDAVKAFLKKGMNGRFNVHAVQSKSVACIVIENGELEYIATAKEE